MRKTESERFWEKVNKTDSCWLWTGTKGHGYGRFRVGSKSVPAHRWSYEQAIGPVPQELQMDHLCRNRSCVNPDHLEPVTAKVNTLRSMAPSAFNAQKTHCPQGHPYDEKNTYISRTGRRHCRACNAERQRQYKREGRYAAIH